MLSVQSETECNCDYMLVATDSLSSMEHDNRYDNVQSLQIQNVYEAVKHFETSILNVLQNLTVFTKLPLSFSTTIFCEVGNF